MNHNVRHRKFGRRTNARKALFKGLAAALIKHESIETTLPKAKDLRPIVEKLITDGKKSTDRPNKLRKLSAFFDNNNEVSTKIVDVLAPRYSTRNGGYLSIIKIGYRKGDSAPMAVIRFVGGSAAAPSVVEAVK